MEDNQDDRITEDGQGEEPVTIWAVRRKLFIGYFWLFSLLFVLVSVVSGWREWANAVAGAYWVDILLAAMGVASGRVLWLAAYSIITVEVVNMIAEYLIVNRYNRGLKDSHRKWQAWYERQQAAQREGLPFDEPPPAGPEGRNGK